MTRPVTREITCSRPATEEDMQRGDWFHKGHPMKLVDGKWVWEETGELVEESPRSCVHCGLVNEDGSDPCLGMLPGVKNACCGHIKEAGYLSFECGVTVRWEPGIRVLTLIEEEKTVVYLIKDTYKFLEEAHRPKPKEAE